MLENKEQVDLQSVENLAAVPLAHAQENLAASSLQASSAFPLSRQFAAAIDNIHTEFVLLSFSDSIFVLITQLDKIGAVVSLVSFSSVCMFIHLAFFLFLAASSTRF
jgi:hypothetical protein